VASVNLLILVNLCHQVV